MGWSPRCRGIRFQLSHVLVANLPELSSRYQPLTTIHIWGIQRDIEQVLCASCPFWWTDPTFTSSTGLVAGDTGTNGDACSLEEQGSNLRFGWLLSRRVSPAHWHIPILCTYRILQRRRPHLRWYNELLCLLFYIVFFRFSIFDLIRIVCGIYVYHVSIS